MRLSNPFDLAVLQDFLLEQGRSLRLPARFYITTADDVDAADTAADTTRDSATDTTSDSAVDTDTADTTADDVDAADTARVYAADTTRVSATDTTAITAADAITAAHDVDAADTTDVVAADTAADTTADSAAVISRDYFFCKPKGEQMISGFVLLQVPGRSGWKVTLVAWAREIRPDEWELVNARAISRESYAVPAKTCAEMAQGLPPGHILAPASTEYAHRFDITRPRRANIEAYVKHCPKPDDWKD